MKPGSQLAFRVLPEPGWHLEFWLGLLLLLLLPQAHASARANANLFFTLKLRMEGGATRAAVGKALLSTDGVDRGQASGGDAFGAIR